MADRVQTRINYKSADGQSREEYARHDRVAGIYSYIDAYGDLRTVQYTAGPEGFNAYGDIGASRRNNAIAHMGPVVATAPAPATFANVVPARSYTYENNPGQIDAKGDLRIVQYTVGPGRFIRCKDLGVGQRNDAIAYTGPLVATAPAPASVPNIFQTYLCNHTHVAV